MLSSVRLEARWEQGTAAVSYCSTTQALCQTLQAASQAAPPDIAAHPQFTTLATDALLACMALSSCTQPASMHSSGSHHKDTADSRENDQDGYEGPRVMGEEHEQGGLPPGCDAEGVQQLQAGLESVCNAGRQLLRSCFRDMQMQMGTAVMLAALAVVQCAPPGETGLYSSQIELVALDTKRLCQELDLVGGWGGRGQIWWHASAGEHVGFLECQQQPTNPHS